MSTAVTSSSIAKNSVSSVLMTRSSSRHSMPSARNERDDRLSASRCPPRLRRTRPGRGLNEPIESLELSRVAVLLLVGCR